MTDSIIVDDFAQLIQDTENPVDLRNLRFTALPHLIGILDTERRELERMIDAKIKQVG